MTETFRVLVTDKLPAVGLVAFENEARIELVNAPGMPHDEIVKAIVDCDALIVRSGTTVTAEILQAGTRLKVVGRAGVGVDNVDVPVATSRGIVVMNTPGGNNVTTAEQTIALLFATARNIAPAVASVKAGKWEKSKFTGAEITGKTLGIVGVGNIGSIVANRAQGLHMKVIAYDPFLTTEAAAKIGVESVELDDLFARADFISVHTPLTDETRGLINAAAIAKMKDGVRIVNCARGGIVDETDLAEAVQSGKVAAAALDVYTTEPPPADLPVIQLERVTTTPHLGASTDEAQLNVAIAIGEQVTDYLIRGEIRNAVNFPSVSSERLLVLGPFLRLGERLGELEAQLSTGAPVEVEIDCTGEVTESDLASIKASVLKGIFSRAMDGVVNYVNAPHIAKERGVRVVASLSSESTSYVNSVTLRVVRDNGNLVLGGAIFGKGLLRLVRIDGVYMEAVPEGRILVLRNRDVPGVVGAVGTLLGTHGINIANFELGRADQQTAISLVHVDGEVPAAVLEELRAMPPITSAQLVDL